MDFTENQDTVALRDLLRRFIAKECPLDTVTQWDRDDMIPRAMLEKMGDLGLCGMVIPEEYGGMGRNVMGLTVVLEELARCSHALAGVFTLAASYGGINITANGSPAQKRDMLPQLARGRLALAYGLSEPNVGADLGNVATRAERRDDRVIVNGAKRWTSGACMADYIYALVRSGPLEAKRKNLSFVLIPTQAKGVSITNLSAMGCNGTPLADVTFDDVEVSIDDVVGGEANWNNGWSMLVGQALEIEKLGPSAMALGTAESALAMAWDYSQQRIQGGKHICGHQAVRHVLSEAQTQLQACRLMLNHAAWLVHTGQPSALATSMAKLFITERAKEITLSCQQQVMGAYGYAHGFAMERFVRDVLGGTIYGGSSTIQRNNIANLLKLPRD
jgi:alkylation response protein AidB-like acyl-CoA dehydrogenase